MTYFNYICTIFLISGIYFGVTGIPFGVLGKQVTTWIPQLGTVKSPKIPGLSKHVYGGDVYLWKDRFFWAKRNGYLNSSANHDFPEENTENSLWKPIERGSYLLPKNIGEQAKYGEIFIEEDSYPQKYLRSLCHQSTLYQNESLNHSCWEKVKETEEWMTLLHPFIKDKKLSELVIIESHDAGTSGITVNSTLVRRNDLFEIGMKFDANIAVNWSITQNEDLSAQLSAGFRSLDLRIADLGKIDGTFRWWHHLSADRIEPGLKQIANFASKHPQEVIILLFGHFVAPGEGGKNTTVPIPEERKDVLAKILISHLNSSLVPRERLTTNPTIGEILATKRNLIAIIEDPYIRAKDKRFWEDFIICNWTAADNPEGLFVQRSGLLTAHKILYPDTVSYISGCVTPGLKSIAGGFLRVYGHDPFIRSIIGELFPEYRDLYPKHMSYEGLWVDLITMARNGTNTKGMLSRNPKLYTSGASIHYEGVNSIVKHWLARPLRYKVNIVGTDDGPSSTLVQTAIAANKGEIKRAVTVSFQGNTRDGFLKWEGLRATGGDDGLKCKSAIARYKLTSKDYLIEGLSTWKNISKGNVAFVDGSVPPDAILKIEVSSLGSLWYLIFQQNVQQMIEKSRDIYLRSSDTGNAHGFAYVSKTYDHFGPSCTEPPEDATDIVIW